jgi:hypothetical protein
MNYSHPISMRTVFRILFVAMVSFGLASDAVAQQRLFQRAQQPARVPAQSAAAERTQQPTNTPAQAVDRTPIDLTAEKADLERYRTELVASLGGFGTRPTLTGNQAKRSIETRLDRERQNIATATTRAEERSITARLETIERDIEREIAADRPRQEARDRQEELDRIARQEREERDAANRDLSNFRAILVSAMRTFHSPEVHAKAVTMRNEVDRLRGDRISTDQKRDGLTPMHEQLQNLQREQTIWSSPAQVELRRLEAEYRAEQRRLQQIEDMRRAEARRRAAWEAWNFARRYIPR